MEIVVLETGALHSESSFRALHPDKSIPILLTPEILAHLGAVPVMRAPHPKHRENEEIYRVGFEIDGAGLYIEKWSVRIKE